MILVPMLDCVTEASAEGSEVSASDTECGSVLPAVWKLAQESLAGKRVEAVLLARREVERTWPRGEEPWLKVTPGGACENTCSHVCLVTSFHYASCANIT